MGLSLLASVGLVVAASPETIHDDTGRALAMNGAVRRIVSLSPGATAMIFAAGGGERVVGTARFSDEPDAAQRIPRIGDANGYDLERVLALQPDVVIAWSGGMSEAAIERLEQRGVKIYRHRVLRLEDVPAALRRFGALLDTAATAERSARQFEVRVAGLRRTARPAPAQSVLLQVWDRPLYTVGGRQLMSDALEACGYRNVFDDLAAQGPSVSVEAVMARDPAYIVAVAPNAAQAKEWLARWRALSALRAVREQRLIALIDQRFSRLGPSVIDAAEELCKSLERR